MKVCLVPKREPNCCSTATPCLASLFPQKTRCWSRKKPRREKECRQIEIVDRTKTWFTTFCNLLLLLLFLFRKLLKCHPIHFWYVCKCFMAAVLSDMKCSLWRFREVDFSDQGMGCHFFSISWVKNRRQEWSKCQLSPAAGCSFEPCFALFN